MIAVIAVVVAMQSTAFAANSHSAARLDDIVLPHGFSIEVYANKVPQARSLALGDNGTVFVGTRRGGRVYALVANDHGYPSVITVARGLKRSNGVAFYQGDLYVSELSRITRYRDIENRLEHIPQPEIVYDSLPRDAHHGSRYIAFGPDEKLYVTVGAPCNICDRQGFGHIYRLHADGSGMEIFASGIRNSVGLTWNPQTGTLWFTDNGRDMLGDDLPPGELNRAAQAGMHFGFPFCHAGDLPDPEYGDQRRCEEFSAPAQKLGPHVAPLGLTFYSGDMFPAEYQGQVFIAEHGSWNRSEKIGYRISLVRIVNDEAQAYEVFAQGWLQGDDVSGRPVDLLVLEDGSMLVSDDKGGRILRISYARPLPELASLNIEH